MTATVEAPKAPTRLSDIGIETTTLRDLLLKSIFRLTLQNVTDMADASCVSAPIINELIEILRADNLIETLGNRGASNTAELRYQLTESGRARALDALGQSEYVGAVPVPLAAFEEQAASQSLTRGPISRDALEEASRHLVIKPELLGALGPAVNSGRSILLYGPPGNGKSVLSNALRDAIRDDVYVPQAIHAAGQPIRIYDPIVHERVEDGSSGSEPGLSLRRSASYDTRYIRCKRPAVITGGELTLDMLDLGFNPTGRTYEAPLQLKSTGGIFIVDDLGRQRESAQALMNRWIVPIEQRYDLLTLQSGQKFTVPFDTLVIFSTNFAPKKLFDGAALRRIYYKIRIEAPDRDDFLKIFLRIAKSYGMEPREEVMVHLLRELYPAQKAPFAAFHAPFLIDQMASICTYEGRPMEMSRELIDRAWANLFVEESENTL